MNTYYNVQMKWVSMVVLITMNHNNHIHSKQALAFLDNGFDTNTIYNVEMK